MLRPEDVQVTDGVLLQERDGLLLALRQLAQHMRIVYGMEVAVEPRGVHQVEEEGQRVLLFEVVQELLLYLAGRDRQARATITIGRADGYYVVEIEPEGEGIDLGRAPERTRGVRPLAYDVLEHIDERTSVDTCASSRTGAARGASCSRPGLSWRRRPSSAC